MDVTKGKTANDSGLKWPINEIVWRALVLRGHRSEDIAEICGVRPEMVDGRVSSYQF